MGSKKHRWPLWKRSLWHALKSLVRNNPRAALSAAGAGTAYAIKGAAEEVESELMGSATPEKPPGEGNPRREDRVREILVSRRP
jgi:hypothetical protein